jgi:hypothetical protein
MCLCVLGSIRWTHDSLFSNINFYFEVVTFYVTQTHTHKYNKCTYKRNNTSPRAVRTLLPVLWNAESWRSRDRKCMVVSVKEVSKLTGTERSDSQRFHTRTHVPVHRGISPKRTWKSDALYSGSQRQTEVKFQQMYLNSLHVTTVRSHQYTVRPWPIWIQTFYYVWSTLRRFINCTGYVKCEINWKWFRNFKGHLFSKLIWIQNLNFVRR